MSPSIVSIITIQTAESELLGVSNIKEWSLAPPGGGGGGRGKTGGERRGQAGKSDGNIGQVSML